MAQPPQFNRAFSFSSFAAVNPTTPLPGAQVDVELSNVKATLDPLLVNLALIQNDDGTLKNESVGLAQLADDVSVGFNAPTVWVTATSYIATTSTVFSGSGFYRCLVTHTSGVFATDLAALKWELIVNLAAVPLVTATQIAVTPSGLLTTNVQTSLQALDSGKAATSHTHPSSALTDGTAAGRAMFSAVNVAAQQSLLGLGALAYLSTVPVTTLATYWNLTGVLSPAALAANTNDWAPTGIATASRIRCSASTPVNVTGLTAAAADGTRIIIENIGATNNITLTAQDTNSAAANRFQMARPVVLRPYQSIELEYDLTSTVWRPMTPIATLPVAGGFKNLKIIVTSDSNVTVTADALTLEDTGGEVYRATTVNVSASNLTLGAVNGLDVAPLAISSWYAVWVIYNPTTNTLGALISLSATAPTMPSGYTFKARVSWVRTDATASPNCKFHRTLQYGRRACYVVSATVTTVLPVMLSGVSGTIGVGTLTAVPVANFVPTTATAIEIIHGNGYNGAGTANTVVAPNNLYGTDLSANLPPFTTDSTARNTKSGWMVLESTNIYYASGAGGGMVGCKGWEDNI